MLEPDEAKVSSPVLRGLAPSNGGGLLGTRHDLFPETVSRDDLRIAAIRELVDSVNASAILRTPSGVARNMRFGWRVPRANLGLNLSDLALVLNAAIQLLF